MKRFTRAPVEVQRRLLRRLLRRAADTEWGRRLDFESLARADDVFAAYQESVPLSDYDDIRADVDRVRAGARDVLWPGTVNRFAVSSGTTSAGKIIPVSPDTLRTNRHFVVEVGLQYLFGVRSLQCLFGKHLSLPGRIEEDTRFAGTMIGEVSGLQAEVAPWYFRRFLQAVPNSIAFMPGWDEKLAAIAQQTVRQDIRLLVMAPTWALVLFKLLIDRHNELFGTAATTVREIWPHLQVFISGGVALASYRDILDEIVGRPGIDYLETYGASEGFFAYQTDPSDPAMYLHLDNGVFYEFVSMSDFGSESPQRETVATVQTGARYALHVSSCSGLWSYSVGDVVRFTQTFPHKIVVAGRTGEMIDRFGEAVTGEDALGSIRTAAKAAGVHVLDFHVAPTTASTQKMPALQYLVEFDRHPNDIETVAGAIDDYLTGANRHYRIRRDARAFGPPQVMALPRGTFYAWLKGRKKRISGQTKVPRMSESRAIARSILAEAATLSDDGEILRSE